MSRDITKYAEDYCEDSHYDFEKYQVKYRRQNILEQINKYPHKTILEIGCGTEPLFEYIDDYDKFVVVEPAQKFYEVALEKSKNYSNVLIINDYVENININEKFDFIVLSSLLHELTEPSIILKVIKNYTNPNSLVYVNVPNAKSFHRLLALESGLIDSVYDKSTTQLTFQQSHIFDLNSLVNLLEYVGYKIIDSGSYFVKPFTHNQMSNIIANKIIDDTILDGFNNMIKYCRDIGSEIYCTASLTDN